MVHLAVPVQAVKGEEDQLHVLEHHLHAQLLLQLVVLRVGTLLIAPLPGVVLSPADGCFGCAAQAPERLESLAAQQLGGCQASWLISEVLLSLSMPS